MLRLGHIKHLQLRRLNNPSSVLSLPGSVYISQLAIYYWLTYFLSCYLHIYKPSWVSSWLGFRATSILRRLCTTTSNITPPRAPAHKCSIRLCVRPVIIGTGPTSGEPGRRRPHRVLRDLEKGIGQGVMIWRFIFIWYNDLYENWYIGTSRMLPILTSVKYAKPSDP